MNTMYIIQAPYPLEYTKHSNIDFCQSKLSLTTLNRPKHHFKVSKIFLPKIKMDTIRKNINKQTNFLETFLKL